MMIHKRYIYPVGQGGFAAEQIENFTIVFDCGTFTSPSMIECCIDDLCRKAQHIDILFISHFDKDHVNSLRYLLTHIKVKKAVTTFIPKELQIIYNIYTNGAYQAIQNLLEESDIVVDRIGNDVNPNGEYFSVGHKWEWLAKSMMTNNDFKQVMNELQTKGIDKDKLTDANYLEKEKGNVNEVFKSVFGSTGPNAKGLIVLSLKSADTKIIDISLSQGCMKCVCCKWANRCEESSCLYVGDADLKNRNNDNIVQTFLTQNSNETQLLLMQIPHHGSKSNVNTDFENNYPAKYYFVNDKDTKRIQKNATLYKSLSQNKKLLVSRALCPDTIICTTLIS